MFRLWNIQAVFFQNWIFDPWEKRAVEQEGRILGRKEKSRWIETPGNWAVSKSESVESSVSQFWRGGSDGNNFCKTLEHKHAYMHGSNLWDCATKWLVYCEWNCSESSHRMENQSVSHQSDRAFLDGQLESVIGTIEGLDLVVILKYPKSKGYLRPAQTKFKN